MLGLIADERKHIDYYKVQVKGLVVLDEGAILDLGVPQDVTQVVQTVAKRAMHVVDAHLYLLLDLKHARAQVVRQT